MNNFYFVYTTHTHTRCVWAAQILAYFLCREMCSRWRWNMFIHTKSVWQKKSSCMRASIKFDGKECLLLRVTWQRQVQDNTSNKQLNADGWFFFIIVVSFFSVSMQNVHDCWLAFFIKCRQTCLLFENHSFVKWKNNTNTHTFHWNGYNQIYESLCLKNLIIMWSQFIASPFVDDHYCAPLHAIRIYTTTDFFPLIIPISLSWSVPHLTFILCLQLSRSLAHSLALNRYVFYTQTVSSFFLQFNNFNQSNSI